VLTCRPIIDIDINEQISIFVVLNNRKFKFPEDFADDTKVIFMIVSSCWDCVSVVCSTIACMPNGLNTAMSRGPHLVPASSSKPASYCDKRSLSSWHVARNRLKWPSKWIHQKAITDCSRISSINVPQLALPSYCLLAHLLTEISM